MEYCAVTDHDDDKRYNKYIDCIVKKNYNTE